MSEEQVHAGKRGKNLNIHVWLMTGILSVVIIAGFWVFPKTQEERDALLGWLGTTNHGTFIQPIVDINDLPLWDADDNIWNYADQKVKWRYLIADDGQCRETCREMLYTTRQVHIRVGKNSKRLERLYLLLGDEISPEARQYLTTEHPYLKVVKSRTEDYASWLQGSNTGWQPGVMRILVVDQNGRAMMFYGLEHDGNGILEDINHLLKYSPTP